MANRSGSSEGHDVRTSNQGSIVLVEPLTQVAKDWIEEHVQDPQFFAESLVVEPRYLEDLIAGMVEDGLDVDF